MPAFLSTLHRRDRPGGRPHCRPISAPNLPNLRILLSGLPAGGLSLSLRPNYSVPSFPAGLRNETK